MTAKKFNESKHKMSVMVDGKPVEHVTITLYNMRQGAPEDVAKRNASYIRSHAEDLGAFQAVGGTWVLPASTEFTLPAKGTKRSSWGEGNTRVIVGLNAEQLAIVISWGVKMRIPSEDRADRKAKKLLVTDTITGEKQVLEAVEAHKADYRDGQAAQDLVKKALG